MTQKKEKQRISHLMEKEIKLLNDFTDEEKKIKEHISKKDWTGLEKTITRLKPLSDNIISIDSKRHKEYQELSGDTPNSNFYQTISSLPDEERIKCSDLYRELKMAVLRMQGVTWSIEHHVKTLSITLHHILDEIFPYRKGKIYSGKGQAKQPVHSEPMVLNHHS